MHLWARERRPGQQLTLDQLFMGELTEFSRASVGLCSPGHQLLRHFYLAVDAASSVYKLSWRQQNVPVAIASVDATFKRGSALQELKIRQTVWSNDVNAPLIAIWVNSASMDDAAFRAVCVDYNNVVHILGMGCMQLLYLDCPFRDGPGAARRFPSLQWGAARAISFAEDGALDTLLTAAAVDKWVAQFDSYQETELEFGLDVEWRSGVPGIHADTLQLVHLGRLGAGTSASAKPVGAFVSLAKVGQITPRLAALLRKAVVGGVKIHQDLKRLSEVYPAAGFHHHDAAATPSTLMEENVIELDVIAEQVNPNLSPNPNPIPNPNR